MIAHTRVSVKLTREQVAFVRGAPRNEEVPLARALAEYAVAHALGQKWDGGLVNVPEWKTWKRLSRDVKMIEVCVGNYATAPLTVYKSDDDVPFVLVIDRNPEYVLAGWMFGADAKKDTYWNEVEKCFQVPQSALRSCTELLPPARAVSGERRDPAPDFAGHGKWPQMRYADPGDHPTNHGAIITSKFDLPCLRCQTIVKAGEPITGDLVTGTIHGDPLMCRMKKRR